MRVVSLFFQFNFDMDTYPSRELYYSSQIVPCTVNPTSHSVLQFFSHVSSNGHEPLTAVLYVITKVGQYVDGAYITFGCLV